jgi:hypothetical protein
MKDFEASDKQCCVCRVAKNKEKRGERVRGREIRPERVMDL